jgi:type IV pilus assembly protein PilA
MSVRNLNLHPLRARSESEQGFTLIELLVVILIIGILAAIAIPTFIGQKGKASDASAKSLAHTAEVAMETYATDHGGSYAGVSAPSDLNAIESTINTSSTGSDAYLSSATGATSGYTVVAVAVPTGDQFTVVNNSGTVNRSCSGSGGGCAAGTW